jgi:hypothetical protein
MKTETDPCQAFRALISRRARQSPSQWEDSRRLMEKDAFPETLARLHRAILEQDLPAAIKEPLLGVIQPGTPRQHLDANVLKGLTGLPPAKALRALCIHFDLLAHPAARWPVPHLAPQEVERAVIQMDSPFDLLLQGDVASILDLGAGDLSFASELVEQYAPILRQRGLALSLHCIDRLHPNSKLGGPLHPEQARLRALQEQLGDSFDFFGDQDMFQLHNLDDRGKLAPRYTIATCWAPATPTFAYEPTRLSAPVISEHLRRTKGSFQQIRYGGEPALEVHHGERALLFPPWKFEIIGPLALLNLVAHRAALCVLGAVDDQVFWEILSQLLEEPRFRPADQPFTRENLPHIFGDLYGALTQLPIGETMRLSELGTLRREFPLLGLPDDRHETPYSFRHVGIRRGATFPGVPASSTARTFSSMPEEVPPWFITLVPTVG